MQEETYQPLPGWPQVEPYQPTFYTPQSSAAPVELYAQPAPVVYVPAPGGQFAAVLREHLPQAPTPAPVVAQPDVWPKRILTAGVAAPGFGWGASMLLGAVAGAETAIGYLAACMALAFLLRSTGGGSGKVSVNVKVDNRTTVRGRGWGK